MIVIIITSEGWLAAWWTGEAIWLAGNPEDRENRYKANWQAGN